MMRIWFGILVTVLVFGAYVAIHEMTHAVIYQEYNCEYQYGADWEGAYTIGRCPGMSEERYVSLLGAQANVEAYGYQGLMITGLLLAILLKKVN